MDDHSITEEIEQMAQDLAHQPIMDSEASGSTDVTPETNSSNDMEDTKDQLQQQALRTKIIEIQANTKLTQLEKARLIQVSYPWLCVILICRT
jgi:hypothetical protein